MKKVLKLGIVLMGFALAFIAFSMEANANKPPAAAGACVGDNHLCGVTSGGTALNGYWVE
jgi:hypothetical protein